MSCGDLVCAIVYDLLSVVFFFFSLLGSLVKVKVVFRYNVISSISAFVVELLGDSHRVFPKLQVVVITDSLRSHPIAFRSFPETLERQATLCLQLKKD